MKRVASAVLGFALVAAVAGPVGLELWRQPLETVRVTGPFVHVSRQAFEAAIEPHLPRAFLMVEVSAIRRAAGTIPWVEDVSVRRVWPGALDIEVREREAVASWRGRMLLEPDGSRFEPARLGRSAALPALAGPPGRHREVLARYRQLDRLVETHLQTRVARLELHARGAWVAGLENGIVVHLGPDTFERHLRRYARAFPKALGSRRHEVREIDLRYGNGFAVRWHEDGEAGEGAEA